MAEFLDQPWLNDLDQQPWLKDVDHPQQPAPQAVPLQLPPGQKLTFARQPNFQIKRDDGTTVPMFGTSFDMTPPPRGPAPESRGLADELGAGVWQGLTDLDPETLLGRISGNPAAIAEHHRRYDAPGIDTRQSTKGGYVSDVVYNTGRALPTMAMGGAGATGAASKLAAGAAFAAPGTVQQAATTMDQAMQEHGDPARAAAEAAANSGITFVSEALLSPLGRIFGGKVATGVVKEAIAKAIAKGAVAEASQEFVEQVGNELTEDLIRHDKNLTPELVKDMISNPERWYQRAVAAGGGALSGGAIRGVHEMQVGPTDVANASEQELAQQHPDIVKPDEGAVRGTPEAAEEVAQADDAVAAQAKAAEIVDKAEAPVSKGEVIDSIAKGQEDSFAIQNAVEKEPGEFVKATIAPNDIQDIPRENLDIEKAQNYAAEEGEAPPVIATTGENGLLNLRDGRHRLLAAAIKAKQAGGDPQSASIQAYVPASWAKNRAASSLPPAGGGMVPPGGQPPTGMGPAMPPPPGGGGGRRQANVIGLGYPGTTQPSNLPNQVAPQATSTPPVRQRTGLQSIVRAFENSAAGRPQDYVRQRERLQGTKELARMDVVKESIRPFDETMKKEGFDPEDRAVQYQITEALRGNRQRHLKTIPASVQTWVDEQRTKIDSLETEIEKEARSLGMDDFADAVKARMGTFLAVAPIKRAGQTVPGGSSRERLNPEVGHFRRDRFVVTNGNGKVVGDAPDMAGAQAVAASMAAGKTGKAAMMDIHEPIPEAWRKANEIHDPRFLVGRTMVEGVHLREMMKLLKIAAPHATSAPKSMNSTQEAAWAKQNGYGKVVDDRRLGPISGKYLPVRMAEDFNQAVRMPSEAERLWLTFNSAWKLSKTAFNLPTSGHNIVSNALTFSYLDGISPMNPLNWKYYKQAATNAFSKNNPVWRKMVEANFAGTGGRYAGELSGLMQDASNFDVYLRNSLLRGAKKGVQGVQEFYGAQDDIFKLAAVLKRIDGGMKVEDAIADARRWWPDNARASKFARWLSNAPLGSSFIRFTDQALRIAGRAAKEHPVRLAMIAAMPYMLNTLSRNYLGLKKEDPEEKLIADTRSYAEPLTPWRDAKGKLQTFDMRYIIPLINDIMPEQKYGMLKLPIIGNTPIATAMLEQFSGRDRFTGRAFVTDKQSLGENLKNRGQQLAKTLAPVPSMLTYGVKDIKEAATGGSERALSHAILNQLTGVNIRTPYIAERNVRKIARNMLLTKDVKQARDLIETWNKFYKPGDQTDISLRDVATGLRQQISGDRGDAIRQGADLIFEGQDAEAAKLVEEYNNGRQVGRISIGAIKAEARKQAAQHRRR